MSALLIVLACCSTTAFLASASRMLWAFSRDKTMPGWSILSTVRYLFPPSTPPTLTLQIQPQPNKPQIHRRSQVPLYSILATTLTSILLSFIILGSTIAFNDIVSFSIAGLFASYLIATILLLARRLSGLISLPLPDHNPDLDHNLTTTTTTGVPPSNTPGQPLVWGPWRIPGIWGTANNIFAVVYLVIILFFSFWPPGWAVGDASLINYSSVMLVGVVALATGYYLVWARRSFLGPRAAHLAVGSGNGN